MNVYSTLGETLNRFFQSRSNTSGNLPLCLDPGEAGRLATVHSA